MKVPHSFSPACELYYIIFPFTIISAGTECFLHDTEEELKLPASPSVRSIARESTDSTEMALVRDFTPAQISDIIGADHVDHQFCPSIHLVPAVRNKCVSMWTLNCHLTWMFRTLLWWRLMIWGLWGLQQPVWRSLRTPSGEEMGNSNLMMLQCLQKTKQNTDLTGSFFPLMKKTKRLKARVWLIFIYIFTLTGVIILVFRRKISIGY